MTELKWADSYDPDAADYDSPAVVKEWYNDGNLQRMHWDSEAVEAIFMSQEPSSTPTPTPSHKPNALGRSQSTRVIVGGAVGGTLGVAAIGMIFFLLVRRHRRVRAETPDSRRVLAPTASGLEQIAEYKPEPWPKDYDRGPRYYSPDSLLSGPTVYSPSTLLQPHGVETREIWGCELSGHQDGLVDTVVVRRGELPGTEPRVNELMDPNMQWAYELPAPLESDRTELPDRKYPQ